MQLEQVIGRRIAERREQAELSQAQLGQRLGEYLTNADGTRKELSRQAVWTAEQGKRAFTAAELVAFADILSVTLEDLLEPFDDDNLEMPSGKKVRWFKIFTVPDAWPPEWEQTDETLESALANIHEMKQLISDQENIVKEFRKNVDRAVRHDG